MSSVVDFLGIPPYNLYTFEMSAKIDCEYKGSNYTEQCMLTRQDRLKVLDGLFDISKEELSMAGWLSSMGGIESKKSHSSMLALAPSA